MEPRDEVDPMVELGKLGGLSKFKSVGPSTRQFTLERGEREREDFKKKVAERQQYREQHRGNYRR